MNDNTDLQQSASVLDEHLPKPNKLEKKIILLAVAIFLLIIVIMLLVFIINWLQQA